MPRRDISWKRPNNDGERIEIYVEQIGDRWIFHARDRRPEQWQVLEDPPLEDWENLLDAVERRIGRGLLKPIEADRIRKIIEQKKGV